MKKICIILSVLLIAAAGYLCFLSSQLNALKETETQLIQETGSMKKELEESEKTEKTKETELAQLIEENRDRLEELEVWQERTAELQALAED